MNNLKWIREREGVFNTFYNKKSLWKLQENLKKILISRNSDIGTFGMFVLVKEVIKLINITLRYSKH